MKLDRRGNIPVYLILSLRWTLLHTRVTYLALLTLTNEGTALSIPVALQLPRRTSVPTRT